MFVALYLFFFIVLLIQSGISIYLSLYIWEDAERLEESESPKTFEKPKRSFTLIIPARYEEKVIGHTLKSLSNLNYPKRLIQTLVICENTDVRTVEAANLSIKKYSLKNAQVITFNDAPVSKPHSLNIGLKKTSNEIVAIFDAEDDIAQNILNVANSLFIKKNPDVIQAGVQLMNYDSHWFSPHNVLEYYFWFKSRMHFHSKMNMVPLGGNTVFFKTQQLRKIGGWNEECLTEDAEIGIRLTAYGARIISTYDASHVTKEETPSSIEQFIKQRARWNQGFVQVLKLGYWKKYDTTFKRIFCLYTLSFPLIQAGFLFATPLIFIFGLVEKLPVYLSLLSFIPLLLLFMQYVISVVALREFINEQHLHKNWKVYFSMFLTYIPYQIVLGVGAVRAMQREILGLNNWEKTIHAGAHRSMSTQIILDPNISI